MCGEQGAAVGYPLQSACRRGLSVLIVFFWCGFILPSIYLNIIVLRMLLSYMHVKLKTSKCGHKNKPGSKPCVSQPSE